MYLHWFVLDLCRFVLHLMGFVLYMLSDMYGFVLDLQAAPPFPLHPPHPAPLTPAHCSCCTGNETHPGRNQSETDTHGAQDASFIQRWSALAATQLEQQPQDLWNLHAAQGGRVQSSHEAPEDIPGKWTKYTQNNNLHWICDAIFNFYNDLLPKVIVVCSHNC